MAVFKAVGLAPKIKLKLLEYLNDAKSSLVKFKPDLNNKSSRQSLKFSEEGKSKAQSYVEQGYDLKIPENIDRSLGSISSEIQKGNKNTAMQEIEELMRELGDN
jgi:hypothetical protein